MTARPLPMTGELVRGTRQNYVMLDDGSHRRVVGSRAGTCGVCGRSSPSLAMLDDGSVFHSDPACNSRAGWCARCCQAIPLGQGITDDEQTAGLRWCCSDCVADAREAQVISEAEAP